nr:microtubule-associated protein RP/EB family member 1-like [Nicotiana tomentosiformis]
MTKSSQTPSKAKSSSKTKAKPKNMKPKSKKSAKPSSEPAPTTAPSPLISFTVPAPSSRVPVEPIILTSTRPLHLKPPAQAPVSSLNNTSKSTKIKATPRKSVKSDNVVLDAAAKVETIVKEAVVQGEPVSTTTSHVKLPPSKLDVLTEDKDDNEGEEEGGVVASHDEHQAQGIANDTDKKRSENWGESDEKKEKEEIDSEEEGDSESEIEDEEKGSESDGEDEESEEENDNASGECEGSMAIGNIVISASEEASGGKRTEEIGPLLTPFTGDEEVSSDEDNLPLSTVGTKSKKAPVKASKSVIQARKKVVPPGRTPLTRNKRKVVDEQIIKESRAQKRKAVKYTKVATPSKRDSKGNKKKGMPIVVDKLTEFRNKKVLNGKILANTDKKGMAQLVEKLELHG